MLLTKSIETRQDCQELEKLSLTVCSYTRELLRQGGDGDLGEHLCAAGDSGGVCSTTKPTSEGTV